MKAQIITQYGDPSVFKMIDLPTPTAKPGQVLIAVHATSVNQIDCKIRSGAVPSLTPEFPAILHGDAAGVVLEVGDNVTRFSRGDEVYGCGGGVRGVCGALAQVMSVDAQLLAHKPKTISMLEAAALPLVSITAYEALFVKYPLQAGESVLIQGGAGGVGHIAIQLAKWAGAKVATTVRNEQDVELVTRLGADTVYDITQAQIPENDVFNLIFDTVGGNNLTASLNTASHNSTVVTTNARVSLDLTPMHSKGLSLGCVFMLLPLLTGQGRAQHGEILQTVAQIVDAGKLKPLIDERQFTLDQVAQAHALLESGAANGKIVIAID